MSDTPRSSGSGRVTDEELLAILHDELGKRGMANGEAAYLRAMRRGIRLDRKRRGERG